MQNNQTPLIRVLVSETHDPWFNLATEDWIFNDMDPNTHILFLWRNDNTVVIGRFQNPWTECHTAKMKQDGINLARRQSGGGAVYQDLGNTNFTFLSGKENFSKVNNNNIIIDAINDFDIKAYASGRNDILIDDEEGPKKISGAAFKEKSDRSFHHGTLLINANLTKLGNYLNPSKKKLVGKGIKSVRSRVTNLQLENNKINHKSLTDSIIQKFFKLHGQQCEIEILNHESLKRILPLNDYYEKLKNWDWRFGETPKFNHHLSNTFSWGELDIHIDAHKGIMKQVKIFSDSLHPDLIDQISRVFPGCEYTIEGVSKAINALKSDLPFYSDELSELDNWLGHNIS